MPDDDPNRPMDRRRFFRQGIFELLRPLASMAESLGTAAQLFGDETEATADTRKNVPPFLRPPGALTEPSFLSTCSRCGDCVSVCPVQCIRIEPARAGGAPFIDVDTQPCALCDGLKCMHACPTGALTPLPLAEIDMGLAVWQADTCVRQKGEACTICVDHCPVGSFAIELAGKRIRVHENGCTGCGVCQHDCPTSPKSILISRRG